MTDYDEPSITIREMREQIAAMKVQVEGGMPKQASSDSLQRERDIAALLCGYSKLKALADIEAYLGEREKEAADGRS